MLRSKTSALARVAVGCTLAVSFSATALDHYLPYVSRGTYVSNGPEGAFYVEWRSLASVFNTDSEKSATVSSLGWYASGEAIYEAQCADFPLQPLAGRAVVWCPYGPPDGGPTFVKVTADPSVLVSADIQRLLYVENCPGSLTGVNFITQGSAPLPVYHEFFRAGSTAVAGPLHVGASDFGCIHGHLRRLRRVNVTLFNGGSNQAKFTVSARWEYLFPNHPVIEITKTVDPQRVEQINSLEIPIEDSADPPQLWVLGFEILAWIHISADQPFLAYVTTIFEEGEPGTNAFTVYEARQTR